jgi:hypothetical protein
MGFVSIESYWVLCWHGGRLLAGFSQTEVDILRTQFHARRIHGGRPIMQTEALDLEEEWLEQNQGDGAGLGGSNFRNGRNQMDRVMEEVSEGSQADMLLGLVMGFVFGIIMLFWIWERGIPRRQKLGILCGIACNLTVCLPSLNPQASTLHPSHAFRRFRVGWPTIPLPRSHHALPPPPAPRVGGPAVACCDRKDAMVSVCMM